ncbi:MAG TPA: hypothetical protein VGC74_15370 [Stenotrophomonas sp.]
MSGGVWEAARAAAPTSPVECVAATTVIVVGALCGRRAALGGIGLVLLAGLAVGFGPVLTGSSIEADRFLLGLILLLCGAVPATMAMVQDAMTSVREQRAHSRALGYRLTSPPVGRKRARTGASP